MLDFPVQIQKINKDSPEIIVRELYRVLANIEKQG